MEKIRIESDLFLKLLEDQKDFKKVINNPWIILSDEEKEELKKFKENLDPLEYEKQENEFLQNKISDHIYYLMNKAEDDYFKNRPFIDPIILEGIIGNGLNPETKNIEGFKHPENILADLGYKYIEDNEGIGNFKTETYVNKSTGEIIDRERLTYSDNFYKVQESLGLTSNFRKTRTGTKLKGQIRKSGDQVVFGIPKLKTIQKDEKLKILQKATSFSTLMNQDHIINMENIYYGRSSYDNLLGLKKLYSMILEEIENYKIGNYKFCIPKLDTTKKQLEKFRDLYIKALKTKSPDDENRAIDYGQSIFIMRSDLTNMHRPNLKFEYKVNSNFSEKINNFIEELREEYSDVKALVSKERNGDFFESLKIKDNIITSDYFYFLRKVCVKKYRRNYGEVNAALIDFDFEDNLKGFSDLVVMSILLKPYKCYIILNRTSGHKKYHGTVVFPLNEFVNIEEIKPIDNVFKIFGFNDINHKYFIGKNIFNYKLFNHLKSPGVKDIRELLTKNESQLELLFNEQIIPLYNKIYQCKKEDFKNVKENIEFLYRKSRKPIIDLDEETLEQKAKLGFYHFDNYEFYHKILKDYLLSKDYNENDLNDLFNDEFYKKVFKDKTYLYNKDKEKVDCEKIKVKLKEIKNKALAEDPEDLLDMIYDDENHLVKEFEDFIFNTHKKCNFKKLVNEFFRMYPNEEIEISKSRWSTPGKIAYRIAANAYIDTNSKEVCDFILNEKYINFCNSDNKYNESMIIQNINNGFNMGKKNLKDSGYVPTESKYDSIKRFWSCFTKTNRSILNLFNDYLKNFYNLKEFKKNNKTNKHYKVFIKISKLIKEKNYIEIYKLIKKEYKETLSKSLNSIDKKYEYRKAINKINEIVKELVNKIIKIFKEPNKFNIIQSIKVEITDIKKIGMREALVAA